jgi:hypothetical protein
MRCQMITFTGKTVNPLAMRPEDVDIRDIAHGLALVNRFGGHTRFPLSVAQHAVHVSQVMERAHALYKDRTSIINQLSANDAAWIGLHHDDSDTYIGDMPRLLKHSSEMSGFLNVESWLQDVLYSAFDCDYDRMSDPDYNLLGYADNLVLRYEIQQAMHPNFDKTVLIEQGLDPNISTDELKLIGMWGPVSWQRAEEMYLEQAEKLRPGSVARYSR